MTLLPALIVSIASAAASAQQHVVVRKPPPGRGFMAPNNGGIWSWGNEILVMHVNGPQKNGTGCDSHSTLENAPGTTYVTSRSLDGGDTWNDLIPLRDDAFGWDTGYPSPEATKKNRKEKP